MSNVLIQLQRFLQLLMDIICPRKLRDNLTRYFMPNVGGGGHPLMLDVNENQLRIAQSHSNLPPQTCRVSGKIRNGGTSSATSCDDRSSAARVVQRQSTSANKPGAENGARSSEERNGRILQKDGTDAKQSPVRRDDKESSGDDDGSSEKSLPVLHSASRIRSPSSVLNGNSNGGAERVRPEKLSSRHRSRRRKKDFICYDRVEQTRDAEMTPCMEDTLAEVNGDVVPVQPLVSGSTTECYAIEECGEQGNSDLIVQQIDGVVDHNPVPDGHELTSISSMANVKGLNGMRNDFHPRHKGSHLNEIRNGFLHVGKKNGLNGVRSECHQPGLSRNDFVYKDAEAVEQIIANFQHLSDSNGFSCSALTELTNFVVDSKKSCDRTGKHCAGICRKSLNGCPIKKECCCSVLDVSSKFNWSPESFQNCGDLFGQTMNDVHTSADNTRTKRDTTSAHLCHCGNNTGSRQKSAVRNKAVCCLNRQNLAISSSHLNEANSRKVTDLRTSISFSSIQSGCSYQSKSKSSMCHVRRRVSSQRSAANIFLDTRLIDNTASVRDSHTTCATDLSFGFNMSDSCYENFSDDRWTSSCTVSAVRSCSSRAKTFSAVPPNLASRESSSDAFPTKCHHDYSFMVDSEIYSNPVQDILEHDVGLTKRIPRRQRGKNEVVIDVQGKFNLHEAQIFLHKEFQGVLRIKAKCPDTVTLFSGDI